MHFFFSRWLSLDPLKAASLLNLERVKSPSDPVEGWMRAGERTESPWTLAPQESAGSASLSCTVPQEGLSLLGPREGPVFPTGSPDSGLGPAPKMETFTRTVFRETTHHCF